MWVNDMRMQTKATAPAMLALAPTRDGMRPHLNVTQRPPLDCGRTALLQRKCACGGSPSGGECEECGKKDTGTLQRKTANVSPQGSRNAPPIVHEVLRSPGQPLDRATRAFFEPRFGHDFSRVRVHTDDKAADSARAVNALAYTVGHQLVFESGRFDPRSDTGRKLIAHELAHVIQQPTQLCSPSALMVTPGQDAFEHNADRLAQTVLYGRQAEPVVHGTGPAVQRQQAPPTPPGPPTMQGPDWGLNCDLSKFPPKCSINTPAGDVPIEKEHWRCVALAQQGRCPPECEDELRPLGIACIRPQRPRTPPPPTGGPECPPGQIPIEGRCIPFRRPESTPPLPPGGPTSQKCPPDQIPTITGGCSPTSVPPTTVPPRPTSGAPTAPHVRFGTIESETLDNFALNDPHVPEQYAAQLDHLAGLLNVYRDVEVHIEGHTDGSGTEAINVPLSQQRAEAVKAKLIARHVVNPARLKTQGFSSHQPQVTSSTPSAQEPRNRRVEVWYHIPPSERPGEGLRMRTSP
jgi:outer membrane protein OmpA-like peptidoglycan-associated protein